MSPIRKASNRGRNIIGYFPSIKMKRMINFESLIERDLIYLLDYEQQVEQFCEQPLSIEYRRDGRKCKYTPDFHVLYSGRQLLLECKPQQFVDDPDNQIKFAVARQWCQARGWTFGVITDDQLSTGWRVKNVQCLTRFSRYTISTEVQTRILALLSALKGAASISDIAHAVNPDAPQTLLIPILHMAFRHQVYIPLNDAQINWYSPVTLPGEAMEQGYLPI